MTAADLGIALIGYGEVGQTLAADLADAGSGRVAAWDRLFAFSESIPSRAVERFGFVRAASGMSDALAARTVVISAVTAGECIAAAREAAGSIMRGSWYLDLNSVSPATKSTAGALIAAGGGRYVEAAVMSSIEPKRIASPILLGGPHARSFLPTAQSLGFLGAEVYSDRIGAASAAKMCRSVMIKGLEALLTESLLVARYHGVEDVVLASLGKQFPAIDWPALAQYMLSRSLQHGRRRAEEMREAARTVTEAGIDAHMSRAIAERQAWAAGRTDALSCTRLTDLLDVLLDYPSCSAATCAVDDSPADGATCA